MRCAGWLQPPEAHRGPFRFPAPPVFAAGLAAGEEVDAAGSASVEAVADVSVVEIDESAAADDSAVVSSPAPPRTGIERSSVLAGGMW